MLTNLAALPLITQEEWHSVRDISIPFSRPDGRDNGRRQGSFEAMIDQAIVFCGSPAAKRLCDASGGFALSKALAIMNASQEHLRHGRRRFRITAEDQSYRVQIGDNAESGDMQLRVIPNNAPVLHDLQMPPVWQTLLMSEHLLQGGLVLFAAPNGQGKTTSASAMVGGRLSAFAGMCNSVEDPIELPLQGAWGRGICLQRPVAPMGADSGGQGQIHQAMVEALRQFPAISGGGTILFVGEICDPLTAAEVIKAASNGHLVIATMHAKSVGSAIRRLLTLATDRRVGLDDANAADLLSESLRGVFSQRLVWDLSKEGWSSAKIVGDFLWSGGYDTAVGSAIRQSRIGHLHRLVKAQAEAVRAEGVEKLKASTLIDLVDAAGATVECEASA